VVAKRRSTPQPSSHPTRVVLHQLATQGIHLHRELLAEYSDQLDLGRRRPIGPSGRAGNRRWTNDEIDILASAVCLHRDHGVPIDDVRRVLYGEADPEAVAAPILDRLRVLNGRATTAA